jgi:hypothetical protein
MKKIAAILLLGILTFNWFGYQLYIAIIENSENNKLQARLDENNYDESELISIKISAIDLPYYTNSKLFERVDGCVEINGVQYRYVKRRMFHNCLEFLCIPNKAAMSLQTAKENYFKSVNDIQAGTQTKKSGSQQFSSKNLSCELYFANNYAFGNSSAPSLSILPAHFMVCLPTSFPSLPEQPPENC